ncbi:hypothetical protein [Flavihumibacter profundi]|uniref:hypothetical protein n=1 Tax=Flavihumibacter profundi TaxID=2716883 RepID=UPI001CC3C61D|nr:hypothetical protein [Flavihumibacter profundi]MBZ5858993.1 hypothetical protein [Flavihumibacter profundi]
MKKSFFATLIFFVAFLLNTSGILAQSNWPKVTTLANGGSVTIYQPQPESYVNNKIVGRCALSVKQTEGAEPVFGAMFFEATVSTERDSRMATLESLKVTNLKFPGVDDITKMNNVIAAIEGAAGKSKLEISIDQLVATINKESGTKSSDNLKNDPPKIIYTNKPSSLILIDGEPKIQKDKDLDAERVINTPYLIFKEGAQWNLYTGGLWYKSASVAEGWTPNSSLSTKLKSVDERIKKQEKEDNGGKAITATPERTEIIVSTEPAELVQTKGEPEYKSIEGTSLLYVSNSTNDLFKDINSQKTFVLIAGRWYQAPGFNGPWTYIQSNQLPADFAKIPEGSEKDGVLASVAGTTAAEEAKIDAEIPQTAKVDRNSAKTDVKYDGNPKFEPIEGTNMELATNSTTTVIKSNGKYFAVDNGIWFESTSPKGPWRVSAERPGEVDEIPPSSPAYNTKYVYIYETTPQYVYVGYTPGYMGSYIYGPTVVYGTGYYYTPWYGAYYYPRPCTWGFGFSYNPWTGWSMNFGFNVGFMHFGFGYGRGYYGGGWFGPPMYRPPYRPPYYGGGYYGNRGPVFINNGDININRGNQVNPNINHRENIYNNKPGVATRDVDRSKPGTRPAPSTRPANPANPSRPSTQPARDINRDNNVFSDREGNAYRKDDKGNWNQRDNQSRDWKPANPGNIDRNNDLNRASQQRDRGATRQNNYQQSRPAPRSTAPSRPVTRPARTGGGQRH